jgi:3-methyladenine DNA glycosylase AlkD
MKKQTYLTAIRRRLVEAADKDHKIFLESLIPGVKNVLGVRTPIIKKLAKDIYKHEDWQKFLRSDSVKYLEERLLQGLVIGLIKERPERILEYVVEFVPRIDNWAVCDAFCSSLKFASSNKALVWKFIQKYLKSKKEFEIRFAVVLIIASFITVDKNDKYIDKILLALDKIRLSEISEYNSKNYYAKMAIAWAISICYIKQPKKTAAYLKISSLDNWTFNKSIQKIIESHCVDISTKNNLKKLKKP